MVPYDGFASHIPGGLKPELVDEVEASHLANLEQRKTKPQVPPHEFNFAEAIGLLKLKIENNLRWRTLIMARSGLTEADLSDMPHVVAAHQKVADAWDALAAEKRRGASRNPQRVQKLEDAYEAAQWEFKAHPHYADKFEIYCRDSDTAQFKKEIAELRHEGAVRAALRMRGGSRDMREAA